ncbi:MAG: hypothetical protein ACLGHG_03480 [Gammaproteobacteria bacterium]
MVQVDVFWGYGWGASLAVAAGAQLLAAKKPYETTYWARTLAFLALFWGPTGLLLLIRHPSWETMQAAADFYDMSEWLVLAFGITNITQGMLGFTVGLWLLKQGRWYAAQMNWLLGYFGMFFILLYGWDGLGYDRFLYDRDMFAGSPAWTPYAGTGGGVGAALQTFFLNFSNPQGNATVFTTLLIDGLWLIPPFAYLLITWTRDGVMRDYAPGQEFTASVKLGVTYLASVFVVGFGCAAVGALTVGVLGSAFGVGEVIWHDGYYAPVNLGAHALSYVVGIPLAIAINWYLLLAPGRPLYLFMKPVWAPYEKLAARR